jgi:hypothetical protein
VQKPWPRPEHFDMHGGIIVRGGFLSLRHPIFVINTAWLMPAVMNIKTLEIGLSGVCELTGNEALSVYRKQKEES